MNDVCLRLYHSFPAPMRVVTASLRGLYLRCWRYGVKTDQLVEAALQREHWDKTQWKKWQEDRLTFILDRAARHVPYYREQWALRRRTGDRSSWSYLENWPILEKESLRQNSRAFVALSLIHI